METTQPTVWTFAKAWIALMILLALTVFAAHFQLGSLGLVVALFIASTKALIILLFFMHTRYSASEVRIFAGAAYLWLMILIIGTLHDYVTRNWLPGPERQGNTEAHSQP